jgi:DNA-binding NarL/FixJ family response regulator
MEKKISVAIVEDDKFYNNALKKIINFDEQLICAGQFYNGSDALSGLPGISPDIVLMDINLPEKNGTELVKELKPVLTETQFIMCTSFEDDSHVYDSLKAGASGYIVKGDSLEEIINAIKDCHRGGAPMSFSIARQVLGFFHEKNDEDIGLEELSKTENQVLKMLAEGLLYKEIADKKFISMETVKKHVGNIYRKLQVNNKIEAINKLNQNKI